MSEKCRKSDEGLLDGLRNLDADSSGPAADRYVLDQVADSHGKGLVEWEEHLRHGVEADEGLPDREKAQIILARRGEGRFKEAVCPLEDHYRVTKVSRLEHLRASPIKPWRDSSNEERLKGENGFLLSPSIDHLFVRGFVSFENGGRLLISPRAHVESLARMGVPTREALYGGSFRRAEGFLDYHRDEVFLEYRIRR